MFKIKQEEISDEKSKNGMYYCDGWGVICWWASNQKGKPYNTKFWNMKQIKSFYCSQLVWATYYYTSGVDLDKPDNNIGSAWAIHPGELVNNKETAIIYRNR